MNEAIEIEAAVAVDPELMEAVGRLIPQLSPTATVPSAAQLQEIAASHSTTLLLARDPSHGGRIVGTLTLTVLRIPTGVRAWIDDVVVDSTARGKGVGEALCRTALRVAATHGAQTVELTCSPSREAANRLYVRLGFQVRETNAYRKALA